MYDILDIGYVEFDVKPGVCRVHLVSENGWDPSTPSEWDIRQLVSPVYREYKHHGFWFHVQASGGFRPVAYQLLERLFNQFPRP